MKQIIFFDIDSTLYSHTSKCVPESTLMALAKLKEKGKLLFIATSRSLVEITNLPQNLMDMMDGLICEGGAKVFYHNKAIIEHTMEESGKHRLIQLLNESNLAFRYCGLGNDINYLDHDDTYAFNRFNELYEMIPPVKKYTNQPLTHILFYCFDDGLFNQIINQIPSLEFVQLQTAFEATAKGVTKGSALKQVCAYLNIPVAHSVCFGDSANDIEMIKQSGLGIAMGNSAKCVQRVSDYVTSDIDDNGIYNACVHFNWFD